MATESQYAKELAGKMRTGPNDVDARVRKLFGILPKAAHGKIPQILEWLDEEHQEDGFEVGDYVSVGPPIGDRAPADTVKEHGLEIDLDSAGLAVRIHSSYGFRA